MINVNVKFCSLLSLNQSTRITVGDHPPHSFWEESQERHMNLTRLIASNIAETLPGKPVYVSIGNHGRII